MGHLCSVFGQVEVAAAADRGRLGRPGGSQMVSRCGIWPELSKKVSWASLAQKLSILEAKIVGQSGLHIFAPPPIEAVEAVLEAHRCRQVLGFGLSFPKR